MTSKKVFIVIPAYNSEKTLPTVLKKIHKKYKILVIDDASTDRTVQVSRSLGVEVLVHKTNRGYGGAQKTAYKKALEKGADIVVMLHPDLQYDPLDIPHLISPIENGKADFTFGSRFAAGQNPLKGGMPMYRLIGNKLLTSIENLFLGTNFTELHSGLRAYSSKLLNTLNYNSYSDDFVFDSQMIIGAVLSKYRIVEVPIATHYGKESSSISIKNSVHYMHQTIYWLLKKKYGGRA